MPYLNLNTTNPYGGHLYDTYTTTADATINVDPVRTFEEFQNLKCTVDYLESVIEILKGEIAELKGFIAEMGWSTLMEQAKEGCIE